MDLNGGSWNIFFLGLLLYSDTLKFVFICVWKFNFHTRGEILRFFSYSYAPIREAIGLDKSFLLAGWTYLRISAIVLNFLGKRIVFFLFLHQSVAADNFRPIKTF